MRAYPPEQASGEIIAVHPIETGLTAAADAALDGRQRGVRAILPFIGPAFIACVAYIDPGNFATNIQGGAPLATTCSGSLWSPTSWPCCSRQCRRSWASPPDRTSPSCVAKSSAPPVVYAMWIVSEVVAMATDLAEFLGASVGLNLLFHIPLIFAALLTGVATYRILLLQRCGCRPWRR